MISAAAKIGWTVLLSLAVAPSLCSGQGLSPRAYVITPVHTNAVTLTYTVQAGNIVFGDTLPIENSTGRIGTETATIFHTLDFFGRSANVNLSLPYAIGHFQGEVLGVEESLYRSGLAPTVARFSVNLLGAPAMTVDDFSKWRQKTLIGASLTVSTFTGQYDPKRLINIGANRWAFKPEVGLSRRWNKLVLDAYGAVWLFTPNNNFFSSLPGSTGPNRQTQEPMGAVELHLSYDVKPRMWFSIDGNYWYGGETSLNGVPTATTLQANSRLGATGSIPIGKHQSLKFSYSGGTYITFGGNYKDASAAWQYSWLGRPK
jgi:Putative MetA-pathway of phenol degradation